METTKTLVKFAVAFAMLINFVSCIDKAPIVVPPVPPVVTLKAYAIPESIAYNGVATVYWETINVTSVTKDGVPVPINGSENISAKKDTTITFVFTGADKKETTKNVLVKVSPKPAPTRTDTLCGRYWVRIEEKVLVQNVWTYTKLDDQQLRVKGYYYPNGNVQCIDPLDGQILSNSNWNWVGKDSINFNGVKCQYKLTDTLFFCSERNGTIITTFKGYKL